MTVNPVEALSTSTAKDDAAYVPTSYYLSFTHSDGTICKTNDNNAARVTVQATDTEFKSHINSCMSTYGISTYTVVRSWVDSAGADTTIEADARGYKYLVTINQGITPNHLTSISIFNTQASSPVNDPPIVSAFAFNTPFISQAASEPLGGNFTLTVARDGDSATTVTTEQITTDKSDWRIRNKIVDVANVYYDNMICWEGTTYVNKLDGREVFCYFRGYKKAVTVFTIDSTHLTGKATITTTVTKEVTFGDALFLDPIPYEYLY